MRWGIGLALWVAFGAAAQTDDVKPSLAVFDLKANDTRPAETAAALNAVVKGLRELDAFEVVSSDDLRQLLAIERQKQLLGIEGDATVAASVQAIGVKNVVVGSVTRTQAGLSAELRLLDSRDNKVVAQRTVAPQPTFDKLASSLTVVAQELVGPLLFAEQGQLLVRTREEGAEVIVDDVSRGSTPLEAPVKLPRGRHRLTVKKDGFISRVTVVSVQREQLTLEDVTLVPSADYVAAYNARNRRLRVGGYVAVGIAAASFVSAVLIDRLIAEPKYQTEFKPRQEILESIASGRAGNGDGLFGVRQECFANQDQCREDARQMASSINTLQILTWVMVGVGTAGVAGAAYCFVSGEDPNRYAQLVASVTPSGGSIGLVGHW
ncbi:MAG: PEGA domain-containing protein [Myxococcaceae bacterium]|nr:PEGA domain-containing protein [Myxococcaceae bacterium]